MTSKPGYLTTEFWLVVLVQLANLGAALAAVLPPRYAAIVSGAVTVAYAIARGWTKRPPVPPVVVVPPAVPPPAAPPAVPPPSPPPPG